MVRRSSCCLATSATAPARSGSSSRACPTGSPWWRGDPPGSGLSSDPPQDFHLADYADVLAGFIEALGYSKVHTLGLSFGAGLALEFYRRFPSMSSSLILLSGYAGWAGSLPPDEVERRIEQVRRLADETPPRFVEAVLPSMFSGTVPQHVADEFADTIAAFHPAGLRSMAEAFAEADLTDALSSIAVPTLLIYGEEDVRAPRAVREALHDAIPARSWSCWMVSGTSARWKLRSESTRRFVPSSTGSRSDMTGGDPLDQQTASSIRWLL